MTSLLLIGGGGHCRSCIDVIEVECKYQIAGIIGQPDGSRESIFGYEILGDDNDLSEFIKKYPIAFITVGQIKSADLNRNLIFSYILSTAKIIVGKYVFSVFLMVVFHKNNLEICNSKCTYLLYIAKHAIIPAK